MYIYIYIVELLHLDGGLVSDRRAQQLLGGRLAQGAKLQNIAQPLPPVRAQLGSLPWRCTAIIVTFEICMVAELVAKLQA